MFAHSDPISETVMTATGYLAGPDVFLPNAVAHAATKVEICPRSGLRGLPPLNEAAETAASNEQAMSTCGL
jgi:nucleoside 2-deoxyribosyltransferase